MDGRKHVYDPVHGSISVDGAFLGLMDRHEVQRARHIRQLGLSNSVFPGANHTRFEHSLGVYHLAGRMSESLGLPNGEADVLRSAAMLHDVCHPPFSHALESIMEKVTGCDHMELSRRLILGDVPSCRKRDDPLLGGVEPMGVILEESGIPPEDVCDLIINPLSDIGWFDSDGGGSKSYFSSRDYAHQIIHGPVDADQMDYLMRDAHYTGVNHGMIDAERILSQMRLFNDKVVFRKGAISAVEGLMVSRSLMYSTVYYHKTVKVAEAMLRRAVEESESDLSELYLMTDADLTSDLLSNGGFSADMMRRIVNRRFYKKCLTMHSVDSDDGLRSELVRYTSERSRRSLEAEIANATGLDPREVIVDVPSESTLLSKIRIGKTDVSIIDPEDRVRSVTRYSTVAKALQSRDAMDWTIMVSAPETHYDAVSRAARRALSLDDSDRL